MSNKNKATITVNEDDLLAFAKKIERNQFEDKSFADKIDDYINGKLRPDEVLKLGTTPFCIREVGAAAIPLVVNQSVIANSMENTGTLSNNIIRKHTEPHDVPETVIKKLPQALRNPVLICKGNLQDTIVVISELKNKEQQNIIVPMVLNVKGKHGYVNRITTIHGKKNIQNYLNKAIKDNMLLAMNTKKADELFSDIGIQSPQSTTIICFDDSIAYSTQNVKHPEQNIKAEIENNRSSDNSISNTEQNVEFYAIGSQPNEKGRILAELHAEVSNDGNFKVNPDYFRSLPRDERAIEQFPTENALDIMQQLSDNAVEFSAVSRKNEVTAITVSKTDVPILQKISESLNNEAVAQAEPKINDKRNSTINPDYYSQLNKSERHISRMSPASGEKVIGALKAADIPFSAVKGDKLTSITVHRDNAQKLDRIINENNNRTAKEYINSDFFKSLPPEERYYTQITGVNDAEKLMDKLQKSDIRFSAVIDRENNTAKLTTDKKDNPEVRKTVSALFSRKSQQGFADKAKARNCELTPKSADRNTDRHESL